MGLKASKGNVKLLTSKMFGFLNMKLFYLRGSDSTEP